MPVTSVRRRLSKFLAKINISHGFIRQYLCRLAVGNDVSLVYDIGTMTDIECFAHVVVGNQDANAPVGQSLNLAFYVRDRDGVDSGKGFVQEDIFGIRGECPGNF